MTDDDSGLSCARIRVWTKAALAGYGVEIATPFLVNVIREDGCLVPLGVTCIARATELVTELNPRSYSIMVGDGEDGAALLELLDGATRH